MYDTYHLWQQKMNEVSKRTDALGNGIDAGIQETVAALQLLGVHTTQSCEGHLDRGEPAPWVDMMAPDAMLLEPKRRELCDMLDTLEEGAKAFEQVWNELDAVTQEIQRRDAVTFRIVVACLDEFYRGRDAPYAQRIMIDRRRRLTIQGGMLQAAENPDNRERNLRAYQDEMNAFTGFLKHKLFSSMG